MKKLLLIAVLAMSLTACNNETKKEGETKAEGSSAAASTESKAERNKKTALASVEAIGSHNPDLVLKDVAPNGTDYGDGAMKPVSNVDTIKAGLKGWFAAFPDVKGDNLKAVADGDWVMVWGDWSGTWKGEYMGQKPSGKSYKVKDVDIFKFNDEGKITEHHNIQSWVAIAAQIGMKME